MRRALFVGTLYLMAIVLIYSCSVVPIREGAVIEIVNEKPQGNCKMLGEVSGSGGSFKSKKNMMASARNDLRNQAAIMGGTVVYVQNVSEDFRSSGGISGTADITIFGMVYRCQ